jgi:hypothetical protein
VAEALELAFAADGAIAGKGYGCAFTGKVASGDGFRSLFIGNVTASGCTDAAFNGQYLRIKLQRFGADSLLVRLKRADGESEVSIAARLTNAAVTAPSVPPAGRFDGLAGEWIGTVGWNAEAPGTHAEVNKPLTLTISSTGSFTGAGFGCTLTGSLASGEATANGCDVAIFNGPLAVRVEREGNGRIEIAFKRESRAGAAEIEGTLDRGGANAPGPMPVADPTLVGQWQGAATWSAGSASGSGAVRFTVAADGTLSGSGFGCALNGTLKLAMSGRTVIGGSVSTSGCDTSALNVTFTAIKFEREDGDAFEFELEREANGVKVRVKGRVARSA